MSIFNKMRRESDASEKKGGLESGDVISVLSSDEAELMKFGYKQEFAREFTNLSTISFAFSIMGVASSVATTLNTPLLLGGPASVVWCWFIGTFMCFCLGTSIAELVSAYPTNGGLYSASAYLVPNKYKAITGWTVGWLNLLGQVAGVASTEFGLSGMIFAAVTIATDGDFVATPQQTVGLFIGLLVVHGLINSFGTKLLSSMTKSFVFINLGTLFAIVIALLVTTPSSEKNSAQYIFTSVNNQTGWSSDGFSFLLGLLSVQWTMTDYDATAHICEEVKRASIAAPVAIFIAVIGTGITGWIYNIVYVMCSGDITLLPGPSGYAAATIIANNVGKTGFLILWTFVCFTAFAVVSTALQANARTFHSFSRDRGINRVFAKLAPNKIPINAVWLVCFIAALMGLLDLASTVAVNAIFSLCAVALDTSYIIPIACKLLFRDHPEVNFVPGPFNLGRGFLQYFFNLVAIFWTVFVVIVLSMPEVYPVDQFNMNYAGPITGMVMLLSTTWYFLGGKKHYKGPRNVIQEEAQAELAANSTSTIYKNELIA